MWVTKPIYESMPFIYMAIGVAGAVAAFFVDEGRWQAITLAAGMVFLIGGLVLWLKRRDYRSSRSRTAFDKTL